MDVELPAADPSPTFGRTATSAVDLVLGTALAAGGLGLLAWVVAVADSLAGGEWGAVWGAMAALAGLVLLLAGLLLAALAQVVLGAGDASARDRLAGVLLVPVAVLALVGAFSLERRPGADVLLAHLVPAVAITVAAARLWTRSGTDQPPAEATERRAPDPSTN